MKKLTQSHHFYAAVTCVCWSSAFVVTRLALRYITPLPLGFLRYLAASLVIAAILAVLKIKPPAKKDWPLFCVSGLFGFALYVAVFNVGSVTVTAATGNVIVSTAPVITALLALWLFRERLNLRQWAAIGVQFLGILVLALYDGVFTSNIGVLWLFLAALSVSLYNIIQRRLVREYSALASTAYSILTGTAFLLVFAPQAVSETTGAPTLLWLYILFLGVFPSAIAYVSWSKAFEKAEKTSQVSNYMFFSPFLTSVLGFVMAGEIPSAATIAGGLVIVLGAVLYSRGKTA